MKIITTLLLVLSAFNVSAKECPSGFGKIPAFSPYNGQDYCMMLDEARKPKLESNEYWTWVTFDEAQAQCVSRFIEGDLPTNSLWQSMARQAELINENWTEGQIGYGHLKADLIVGGILFKNVGAGNWEYVQGTPPQITSAGFIYQLQHGSEYMVNGLMGDDIFHFGTYGFYGQNESLGVKTNASLGITRGGDDEEPGVFGMATNHGGKNTGSKTGDLGFRCVCPLAYCGI